VLDDLDGSATELGLVLAAAWIPQILFMLIGGVWADRLPRNLLMVTTDTTLFCAQAATAALVLTGSAALWNLIALQAVRGLAESFFFPAIAGVVPQVVSPGRLQQANALIRLSHSSTRILGAASAGVVVALAGAGWALAFDAATYLASALFLVRIRLPRSARLAASNFLEELREGWDEFWSRTWLWAIVVASAVANLAMMAGTTVLGPVVAKESLGGAAAWGAIVAAEAVGFVLGGLVVLRFRPERPLFAGCLGMLLTIPLFGALALAAPLPVVIGSAVLAGFGIDVFGVLWTTVMQEQIPENRLSRVSAYDALGSFLVIPVGLVAAGPVADAIGVAETIWLSGAIALGAVGPLLAIGDVRNLRRRSAGPVAPMPAP
jgi:predicted MFS family arabinose efflux permease